MNTYLGWTGQWDERLARRFKIFKKHTDLVVSMPAGVFTFQDVNPNSVCWPYFGVQMREDSFFNWPNSSHNRGGLVAYVDGHVEYHKWQDPRTVAARSPDYHMHSDPSPKNLDLALLSSLCGELDGHALAALGFTLELDFVAADGSCVEKNDFSATTHLFLLERNVVALDGSFFDRDCAAAAAFDCSGQLAGIIFQRDSHHLGSATALDFGSPLSIDFGLSQCKPRDCEQTN